jgi:translocation and assembly module TamA
VRGAGSVPRTHSSFPFAAAFAFALSAQAQSPDAPAQRPPPSDAVRYRLIVEGPNPPADALRQGLDLAHWQADEEMTLALLELLVRDAVPQAREISAIEGFYDAKIDVTIEREARPVVVRMNVDPGAPVRVTSVNVNVTGPALADAPLGTGAVREARSGWDLDLGRVFRQEAWLEEKDRALATLRRSPYAAARIVRSEARVEPDRLAADLTVEIDSGPPFAIGPLVVKGTQRYVPALVENFSTLERGEPYTQEKLDAYVRRLAASGYFASVHASIDPATATPGDATVDVTVIDAPTHRFEGAISYSTDSGFGVRGTYTNVNLDDKALQMRVEGRVETKWQLAEVRFGWPPTASRWLDSLRVGAQRRDIENTVETTAAIGVERRAVDERNQPYFGAAYYYDRQQPQDAPTTTSYATYLEAGYVIRRVDDVLMPTRGWMVDARVGAGIPGASTEGFFRTLVRAQSFHPFDRQTSLVLRGEVGAVIGAERENVPSVLRFRTGGDTSVRGYAYESLGVQLGEGIVGGRAYALASAEVIRWIDETWGVAAFVDAGDAANDFGDLDIALGYGIGARLRTPIGPFRIDLAYGERTREFRLHFAVGVAF